MKKLFYFVMCMAITTMAMAQIPTTGLQGLYQFESTLADSSGNGNHLTTINNPTAVGYVPGRNNIGEALFTGDNSLCAGLISPSTMSFTNNATTISFWGKFDNVNTGGARSLITVLGGGTFTYGVEYQNSGTPFLNFYAYHNTALTSYTVVTISMQNFITDWHHYTFTIDATKAKFYVDGAFQLEVGAVSSTVNSGANSVRLSHGTGAYCFSQGNLDEVAIYNQALTAGEVRDLFYALYEGPCVDVITASIPSTKKQCPASALVIPVTINNVYNPNFEWFKDGQPIANSNNDTLNLTASATNNGNYTVRITTSCDTVTVGPTEVTMVDANLVPVLTLNVAQLSISPADGTGYNWYTDGVLLVGNSALSSITASNAGLYTAEIVYGAGAGGCTSVPSNGVTYCPPFFEVIANGFASGINSATVCEEPQVGGSINAVTGGGNGQRTIQWYKDGQPINGATGASYIYNRTLSAAGTYTYRVASICDTAFSIGYVVTVLPRPTVSISASGSTLTASPPGNNNYDWYYNGNYITSGQSITAVGNGIYTVFLTDANGCVSLESAPFSYTASTSSCADSISGNFVISIPYTGCETGGSASFNSPLTGNGITHQWFKDGNAISGATQAFYATTLNAINNGVYTMQSYTSCDTVTFGGTFTINLTASPAQPTLTANGTTLTADQTADEYIWLLDGDTLPETTQSITMVDLGNYQVVIGNDSNGDFCYSTASAGYLYFVNNGCTFNTTYVIGSGGCPDVEFTLDGATLPVTAYITYTGLNNPITQTLTTDTDTVEEFCPSTYNIIFVDDAGCADTVTFTITEIGIGQVNNNISVNLYPNPASHTLAISTSEVLTGVEVYNIMGQQVVSLMGNITQLDVTNLPAGTYYLNATTAKGSVRKPFVKY